MRRLLLLAAGTGALVLWQWGRDWQPPLTDGCLWQLVDTCTWSVKAKLPHFSENALAIGDELRRIDYQPVCGVERIPPARQPGQLFLYEVSREGATHLVFVESLLPFALGWPSSEAAYSGLIWWGLVVLLFAGLVFSVVGGLKGKAHIPFIALELGMIGLGLGSFWLIWAGRGQYDEVFLLRLVLTGWLGWALLHIGRWWGLLIGVAFVPVLFFVGEKSLYFLAEAVIGMYAFTLPLKEGILYGLLWGLWVVMRVPALLPALVLVGLGGYAADLWRSVRLLSPEVIGLRLSAVGIGMGMALLGSTPLTQLLWGASGYVGGIFLTEGMWRLLQSRQRRVRLLQERLPLLWERIQKTDLLRFAEETLQAYANISEMAILRAEGVGIEARPWLGRMREAIPVATENLPFVPDVILPLPAYGWLLLREGTYKLNLEDVERLMPFAAGLSIALRHAELFEAAHEARLAALRGQLSPHFLFNALNTLQSLIGEDPALAEVLMSRLGALLRRSLAHARQVTVPLEEELALVQDYLAVEQQRFGRRLIVEWDVPTPCPTADIPPFAIQLLAENVIKHAVSRLTRPVRLQIRVQALPHAVLIEVIDDGPGIEVERIRSSVGLSNLITRLEELYTGQASLLAERLNPGTRVSITLPRRFSAASDAHTRSRAEDPFGHGR